MRGDANVRMYTIASYALHVLSAFLESYTAHDGRSWCIANTLKDSPSTCTPTAALPATHRTCESMSVEALVLSNRAVAGTDAFKRQSVTSERWLRLLEVGGADVASFLQERRQAGYTIIGRCISLLVIIGQTQRLLGKPYNELDCTMPVACCREPPGGLFNKCARCEVAAVAW
jgi:hypothetical protein